MKSQNWLYNYQFKDGIKKSFHGLFTEHLIYMNQTLHLKFLIKIIPSLKIVIRNFFLSYCNSLLKI